MRSSYLRKRSPLIATLALQLGVALASVGLALGLTLPLRDELDPAIWGFFYAAVVVTAYFAGPIAALAAAAIGIPLAIYFLVPPYESFNVEGEEVWLPALLFGIVSVMVAGLDWYRRRAEAARDVSERRYGQVFEGAGISLWREDFSEVFGILEEVRARGVTDIVSYLDANPEVVERAIEAVKIIDVNAYTLELFGARNIHDLTASLAVVFTPESRESFKRELATLYEGERFMQDEIALRRLDGHEFVALFTVTVLGAPSTDVLISVLDISDRHDAEQALVDNQERLELAMSAGRMGTFEWDIVAQTIRWGAEIEALRGAETEGEFEGTIAEFLEMVHPEDRESLQLAVTRTLQAGAADLDVEYRALSTTGRTIWFAAKGRVQRDAAGTPLRISGVAWDVTARKQSEIELRESEERFRVMADTAPVMIWVADTGNMGTWFNRPWLEFRGKALEEELGAGWISGIHSDDLDSAVATCEGAFEKREEFRMELRLQRADGEYRWMLDHGVPRYGPDGEFVGYIGSCIDVHERKENEERDRFLAETSAILVSSLDYSVTLDRIVRSVVPVFADFCVVDLLGDDGNFQRMAMAYHDESREQQIWKVLRTRPPGPESDLVTKAVAERTYQLTEVDRAADLIDVLAQDDEHRAALADVAPCRMLVIPMIASGRAIGTLTLMNAHPDGRFTAFDIGTLQELAERAALTIENSRLYTGSQRARQRQEFLVHAGAVLSSTLDYQETLDHVVRLAVPEIADSCALDLVQSDGLPRRVVFAHRDPEMQPLLEELSLNYRPYANAAHPVRQVLRTGEVQLVDPVNADILRQIAEDDRHAELLAELRPASVLFVPLKAHGEFIGVMTMAMGAEHGRAYNRELVLTAEGLAQRAAMAIENARLYAESQQVQEELRKANMAKDEFLGMVSHELRTPVTTMYSGARLLLSRYDDLDDDVKREVIRDVESESERLQLIIENLLALAREELGQRVQMEPVSVQRAVGSAVQRLEKARRGRVVKIECCGKPHYVSCVPIYLDLVLRNVIDNADKYSPRDEPIEVTTSNDNGRVMISIRDHGPGVSDAEASKIYERFYRSTDTAKTTSGAGIGLAVCQRLMETQGGTIESRNAEGGGLEVTLSLPAEEIG